MGSFYKSKIISTDAFLRQNVGIAAVTPSYKLREILYSDKLKEHRSDVKEHIWR